MRDYGKVHTSFWTSQTTRTMSEDARSMAMYLLTCPHGTISGAFRLPDGYVCDDLQWSSERVNVTLAELLSKGFANRCETTKWVWINKHFEWNKPENPNQFKSASKIALSIPDECCWKADYMRLNAYFLGIEYQPFVNPSETLSQPVTVTVTVTEAVSGTGTVIVTPPEESGDTQKNENETDLQKACKQTWGSYSNAYFNKYQTEPVRNAKVNSQVKDFVKRLGFDEAPLVADWFLTHTDAFYVRGGHTFGLLAKDAEKLRTEWATGRTMNGNRARQVERSGSMVDVVNEIIREGAMS